MNDFLEAKVDKSSSPNTVVRLSIADFLVHLAIIIGILDAVKALREYLSTPNVPIVPLSFIVTVIVMYAIGGFLWSLPIRILNRWKKEADANYVNRISIWGSSLLLPFLLIPIFMGFKDRLFILSLNPLVIFKNIIGLLILLFYAWLLFYGLKILMRRIHEGLLALRIFVLAELVLVIFGYMIVVGINGANLIINSIVALILIILAFFLTRSRLSPITNGYVRNLYRIVAVLIIAFPFALNAFANEKSSGVKSRDGNGSIILITIDALRTDYLSMYGSSYSKTPNIDDFAKDAVVFDKMHSVSPWTVSSMVSLASGVYPSVHGANAKTYRIQSGIPTLAENLRERGYSTGAFFVNPLMCVASGLNKGFDEFYESYTTISPYSCLFLSQFFHDNIFIPLCKQRVIHYDTPYVKKMESRLFPWIDRNKDKKVFLWVHYFDPHAPYGPPNRYLKREIQQGDNTIKFADYFLLFEILSGLSRMHEKTMLCLRDLYSGDIDFVDERVGLLLKKLENVGWTKGATIIISADHGEEFYEHKGFEHGHTFYQELMHLPLIIKVGNGVDPIPTGNEKKLVNTLDITSTISDIGGLETLPFYQNLQGTSLLKEKNNDETIEITFMEAPNRGFPERIAVLKNDIKFIFREDGTMREIYNIELDPFELHNLIGIIPSHVTEDIFKDVEQWKSENNILKKKLRTKPEADDEKALLNIKLIQGLGYFNK